MNRGPSPQHRRRRARTCPRARSTWRPQSRELGERLNVAATSLAIHAGINSADAVCGIRLGKRSGGQNHEEVLGLLDTAGADGKEIAKELARLLPLKTKAEYDHVDVSKADAVRAVERARRSVAIARRVVGARAGKSL